MALGRGQNAAGQPGAAAAKGGLAAIASGRTLPLKKDRRRQATQAAIIETAEELFAEFGIDAVSLRQIGAAIGSGNTNVVAYHFGTKAGLVEAIFSTRLRQLEERREHLLREADDKGHEADIITMLECIWRPVFEFKNCAGKHTFAGFLDHIIKSQWRWVAASAVSISPTAFEISNRIKSRLPESVHSIFIDRLHITSLMVLRSIHISDFRIGEEGRRPPEEMFMDAIQMTSRALSAGVR